MADNDNRYAVPSVERAFAILETLADTPEGLGLSDLARRLGFVKSTAYMTLVTLERLGYIYRESQTQRYLLTIKLFAVGSQVLQRFNVRRMAEDLLRELWEKTGETVNLGSLQGDEAIYIESLEGRKTVRVSTWPGKRLELHCTALGKVLLAFRAWEEVEILLEGRELTPHTARTVVDLATLRRELEVVRQLGYAVDRGEDVEGVRCVGAPVFDRDGAVVAAVSITAPEQRMPEERIPRVAAEVVEVARKLSERLGYLGLETAPGPSSEAEHAPGS